MERSQKSDQGHMWLNAHSSRRGYFEEPLGDDRGAEITLITDG